jgi:hypothetical protein
MARDESGLFGAIALGALVAAGAFVLALLLQTPLLNVFYLAIPGEKSSDGPIFVLLAYPLAPITAIVAFVLLRNVTRFRRAVIGVVMGPAVMIIAAAFCGWAARRVP